MKIYATVQGSLSSTTSPNDVVDLDVVALGGFGIQITGTFVGTLQFKGSTDKENFRALNATPPNSTTAVSSATAVGIWTGSCVGLATVRVQMSAFTSGVAIITLLAEPSAAGGGGGGGGGGGAGTADSTAANQVLEITDLDILAARTLDYDTGAGTAATAIFGFALPASGGPVAGGTTTNPVNVALPAATVSTLTPPSNTGYATSAKQDTGNTSVASLDTKAPALGQALAAASVPVVLTAAQITTLTPVSTVTANAGTNLNTSALATVAKQPSLGTAGSASTDVITIQGIASGTVVPISVATIPTHAVTVASGGIASGAIASGALASGSVASGAVASGALASGSIAAGAIAAGATSIADNEDVASADGDRGVKMLVVRKATPANTSGADGDYEFLQVSGGKLWTLAAGSVATNVAIADNPVNLGAQAVSSENAAVTTARQVQLVADLVGKLIVLPYANPENFVSGVISSAMTSTTSTSLVAAPASGLRNYITQITVSNSHATVGTDIIIQDGSGGTTLYVIPAAAVFGGATLTFPVPLRQPTTATAIYCANVTTGANTKVSASGYKGV